MAANRMSNTKSNGSTIHHEGSKLTIGRAAIYVLLIFCALYYLIPLYVMLSTSVKTLDEIRERQVAK